MRSKIGTVIMAFGFVILLVATLVSVVSNDQTADANPQQIHLSLGRNLTEVAITWTTYDGCGTGNGQVRYGIQPDRLDRQSGPETCTVFHDGGPLRRKHFIHRVLLTALEPRRRYYYQCRSNGGPWSKVISFKSLKEENKEESGQPEVWRVIIYGDLGLVNGQSIPRIEREVQNETVDLIVHVGDFAYDLDSNDSYVGDEFLRTLEPIASRLPYQTCPGNHEQKYNFSNYVNRFTMYDMMATAVDIGHHQDSNHFHSFHLGPVQFIGFSTEFYFFIEYGMKQAFHQYRWLERTLSEADRPENRRQRPWIVTFGHRPMYCTNDDLLNCQAFNSIVQKGWPYIGLGLEQLFQKYHVDVAIWGHEHSYERTFPVYNGRVYNGTERPDDPYYNPGAPVHIITGSAGCKERIDGFSRKRKEWSAIRIADYGYTKMTILNRTHLRFEQISDDQNGTVVDRFMLTKTRINRGA